MINQNKGGMNRRAEGLATYTVQRTPGMYAPQKSSVDDFNDEAIREQIQRKKQIEKEKMMAEYLQYLEKKKGLKVEEKKTEEGYSSIVLGEPVSDDNKL